MNNTFKKRIDELGRIVIPKQIRNTFKINDFDELELFIEDDNIVIKKTGGIKNIKDKLDIFVQFIKKYLNISMFIVDNNEVISSNIEGINYKDIINKEIINSDINDSFIDIVINKRKYSGYIKSIQIIVDSNNYGKVIFLLNKVLEDNNIINDIVAQIVLLIK